ncbi:MAG TPA: hypothetical protein VG146_10865 [Verrucomicrobiae bacterium]|nr:hypothetical protein [Verrucomicrobiae bacterium]
MFSEQIELRGHIIDSLILPKVLDEILTCGGSFTIREVQIGKQRNDPSYALIDVFGPSTSAVDDIVRRLRQHGAEVVEQTPVRLVEAPADGVFPEDFYVTTNQQTFVNLSGKWIQAQPATMDCGIAVDVERQVAQTVKFSQARRGMQIAMGHHGIRVMPVQRSTERPSAFEFMASNVSSEKPKSAIIREIAAEFRRAKEGGGKILVVAGPAVVHTGRGTKGDALETGRGDYRLDDGLHSIAVGNLLPASVKTICVDSNPSVITKLTDRGTFQAIGLVTDIEPFLRELKEFLAGEELPRRNE